MVLQMVLQESGWRVQIQAQTNCPLYNVVVELVSTTALLEGISTIFHDMFNVELGTE